MVSDIELEAARPSAARGDIPPCSPPRRASDASTKLPPSSEEHVRPDDVEKHADDDAIEHRDHQFRSGWHTALFIFVATASQTMTQVNLGNVIFPLNAISAELGLAPAEETWPVASYSLVVGAFVLVTGRLGDLYGKKTLVLIGWTWFTIWAVVAGTVTTSLPFILARAFLGLGPAALLPNSAGLLGQAFKPGPIKTMAFGLFGALSPIGFVLGGLWGSLCGQLADYKWAMRSEAIVTALLGVMAYLVIPDELNTRDHQTSFDYLGSGLGVSALVLIFFSVTQGAVVGWSVPYTYILLIVGILLVPAFVIAEKRVKHPVLPMPLFANRVFGAVAACMLFGWMSFGTYVYYTPLLQVRLRGASFLEATAQWIPIVFSGCLAIVALSWTMPRAPAYVVFGGSMLAFCVGAILLSFQEIDQSWWRFTFPSMLIICWGPEWSFASSSLIVSDAVPPHQQGVAGSFINTITNFSIAIGLALAGNIEVRVNDGGRNPLLGYKGAWWMSTGMAVLAIVIVVLVRGRMTARASPH